MEIKRKGERFILCPVSVKAQESQETLRWSPSVMAWEVKFMILPKGLFFPSEILF